MSDFSLKNYPYRSYVEWGPNNWYTDDSVIGRKNIQSLVNWLISEVGPSYLKSSYFRDKVPDEFKVTDDEKSMWSARWPGRRSRKLIFYFKNKEDYLKFILSWT